MAVQVPEGGGATLGHLHAAGVLAGAPPHHPHHGHRGAEAAVGVRRDPAVDALLGPQGGAPLPEQAWLLRLPHVAEIAEGPQAGRLQGPAGAPQQHGDETGYRPLTEQQLLLGR